MDEERKKERKKERQEEERKKKERKSTEKKRKEFQVYETGFVDFVVPVDHRIKLKECEKKDKYLDLARELKKLWNMKVTIVL